MQSCSATCLTSPSHPSNKVELTYWLFVPACRTLKWQIRMLKSAACLHWLLSLSPTALKETCDWFVANYDSARKWKLCQISWCKVCRSMTRSVGSGREGDGGEGWKKTRRFICKGRSGCHWMKSLSELDWISHFESKSATAPHWTMLRVLTWFSLGIRNNLLSTCM